MDNKILLEEIKRIHFISNYNLLKTSVENKEIIYERPVFKDFLTSTRGTEVVRGEIESILKAGTVDFKTAKNSLGGQKTLKKTSDILKALKEGRLAESSVADLKSVMMKNTTNKDLMTSIANDVVNSEKFISDYSHLSHKEIKDKLKGSAMNLDQASEQTRAILNAHELKLAEDLKNAKIKAEDDLFRDTESLRDPTPYKSEKEWKSYDNMTSKERVREYKRRYPNSKVEREAKTNPKGLFTNLKDAGILIWKGGKWVISNALWILIFGGLAYGIWKYWSKSTGVLKDCGEGMVEDPETGDCVKGGTSQNDDLIVDKDGNTYNPCTGVYKIGCVTSDGIKENGTDYISQAQECLGLSPTGMFNKELENKLYNKINKRSFTKADLSLICMAGGTLAAL